MGTATAELHRRKHNLTMKWREEMNCYLISILEISQYLCRESIEVVGRRLDQRSDRVNNEWSRGLTFADLKQIQALRGSSREDEERQM